ncbi:MAG TPA: glycogen-binding domain-containing protein [Longimicrobiales bacterium]|nr:glycogen-binding domain-containing protein [Longimicrobiales bacterium]
MSPRRTALLTLGLLTVFPRETPAQSFVTAVYGETGGSTSGVVASRTLSLGYVRGSRRLGLGLIAGVPPTSGDGTRWAAVDVWGATGRLPGPLRAESEVTGFVYDDRVLDSSGVGAELSLRAMGGTTVGDLRLDIFGGARGGLLATGDSTLQRVLPGIGSQASIPLGPVTVRGRAALWAVDGATYPEAMVEAHVALDRFRVTGGISGWLHERFSGTGWRVSTELRLTDRLAVVLNASRTAGDPLFWTEPRQYWALGLRSAVGSSASSAPVPAVVLPAGETVRFEVNAAGHAGPVRVAGKFSGWEPLPMRRQGCRWVLDLALEPGVHEFAFVDGAGAWFVPEETPGRKADGYGGFVGTVVVR